MSKYPSRSKTERGSGPYKVLIVDDDPDILESFTQILENNGYHVDSAETGHEFLTKAKDTVYDIAIVDLKLPDMEGTELLRNMRHMSPQTKKIVITGYPTLESAIDAMGSGTDAYLLKPVEPDDFLRVVEEKIREKEESQTLATQTVKATANQLPIGAKISRVDKTSQSKRERRT